MWVASKSYINSNSDQNPCIIPSLETLLSLNIELYSKKPDWNDNIIFKKLRQENEAE